MRHLSPTTDPLVLELRRIGDLLEDILFHFEEAQLARKKRGKKR